MPEDLDASTILPNDLVLLAANERAIKALYEEYARQLPEHAAFWLGLAAEEEYHATLIETLGALPAKDARANPRFAPEAITTFSTYVREQRGFARQGTTMAAAVATAHNIEIALIERRFFEQLPQRSPEVVRVMARLKKETEQHVQKTKNALTRLGNQAVADTQ